ncbi:MAG: InlB B-repeat-containing protein [Clostridia bacterium]|nr:InlB B-repeat-containing protein [Clostridia bacterium]
MHNRIFCFVLCICLFISSIQLNTSAEAGCHEGYTSVNIWDDIDDNGGNYVLETDLTVAKMLEIDDGASLTICLNGHTLTFNAVKKYSSKGIAVTGKDSTLCICDCKGNGIIHNTSSIPTIKISNYGVVIIEGGTIKHEKDVSTIQILNNSHLFLSDGIISNTTANESGSTIFVSENSNITISGGSIIGTTSAIIVADGDYSSILGENILLRDEDGNLLDGKDIEKIEAASSLTAVANIPVPEIYRITLNANGGILNGAGIIETVNQKLPELPTAPTRHGYNFNGWFNTADGDKRISTETEFLSDATIYAQWSPIEYSITYNLNNGINADSNPEIYTVESESILLSAPSREGYSFAGWFDNADLSGDPVTAIPSGSLGSISLWAKWIQNAAPVYIITLDANGGILSGDVTAETVEYRLASIPDTPIRHGYTFNGWYKSINGGSKIDLETEFHTDTTIYAQWTAISYPISYHLDGGRNHADNPVSYSINSDTILILSLVRDGYSFMGWYDNEQLTGNSITSIPAGSTGDVTLWAKWEENVPEKYSVTVTNGSGSGEYAVGSEVIISAETIDGMKFINWSVTSGDIQLSSAEKSAAYFMMPAENVEITALYESIPASVESININSVGHQIVYKVGENLNVDNLSILVCWSGGESETVAVTESMVSGFDSTAAGSIKLTIIYEGKTTTYDVVVEKPLYHVTVTNGSGSGNYYSGDIVTIQADSIFGYTFRNWVVINGSALELNPYSPITTFTMSNSDVKILAVFKKNSPIILPVKTPLQVTTGHGGHVSPSGMMNIPIGSSCLFTFTPMDGYEIDNVYIDGRAVGAVTSYLYISTESSISSIEVHFRKAPIEEALPFTDLNKLDWFYEDVELVYRKNIMIGVNETGDCFAPYKTASRAMLVTMLWRLDGEPSITESAAFNDVHRNEWYSDAIAWAASNGIVNGYGNGRFGTKDAVSREQIMAILFRYADYKGWIDNIPVSDSPYNCSKWAENNIHWAASIGLTGGIESDISNMTEHASRAEIAAFFARFCRTFDLYE